MVIVDSSVWISFLRDAGTAHARELDRLLEEDAVAVPAVVAAEVLQGARSDEDFLRLATQLEVLHRLEATWQTWVGAARMATDLRRRGHTVPLMDLLIAKLALEGDHALFTLDSHFELIPGLVLHQVPPA